VDEDATAAFNMFYRDNQGRTFDAQGNLLDPTIVPPDVIIRGVFEQDRYGLPVHVRNADGTLRYVAVRREIGLSGYRIRSALVERSHLDRQAGGYLYP